MKKNHIYSLLFFIFSNAGVSAQNIYANITADSAYSMIQANSNNPDFIIIDVRKPTEYIPEHIDHAVNLNYYNSDFAETMDTLIKTKKYLIHCHSGSRSGRAFKIMKELKFKEVYNMKGGISSWKNSSYPTVDTFYPVLMSVTKDSLINFGNVHIGNSDTMDITITNFGNDTLKFSEFTDLSTAEFSTDFDINHTLTGFDDYTFRIFYTPTNYSSDTINFSIYSNGGELNYVLHGESIETATKEIANSKITVYPNPTTGVITIKNTDNLIDKKIEIFDISGKKAGSTRIEQNNQIIINYLDKGVYFLKVKTTNNQRIIKIIKI